MRLPLIAVKTTVFLSVVIAVHALALGFAVAYARWIGLCVGFLLTQRLLFPKTTRRALSLTASFYAYLIALAVVALPLHRSPLPFSCL